MSDSRTIPTKSSPSAATFRLFSEGNELSKSLQVISIAISEEVNKIAKASIVFLDGDAAAETFSISEMDELTPGKQVEIKAGYNGQEDMIYSGLVISQTLKVKRGSSYLIVECRDAAVKMTLTPQYRYFEDQPDSDILEEIIGYYELEKEVNPTSNTQESQALLHETDWAFLLRRTQANGMIILNSLGKLTIKKPDFSTESELNLQYGATILELDTTMDARLQPAKLLSKSWDYSTQELRELEAAEPEFTLPGDLKADEMALGDFNFRKTGAYTEPEFQAMTDAEMLLHRAAKIKGRIKVKGNVEVKVDTLINLNGLGKRFNGKAWVSGIAHQLSNGTWETDIQIGYPKELFETKKEPNDPSGFYIGVVSQLKEDPKGEHRIKVKLPIIDLAADGIWARVVTPDAGENRGFFFRPEVGDEVVVGFLDNDSNQPLILGMCNSSAKAAPLEATDENHEKALVTRSGMKLFFDDDKKICLLETPSGNKISMDEDQQTIEITDQFGNSLKMTQDAVEIKSIKDVLIKADKDLTLEGVNVNVKAQASLKTEGSASAELSSGGNTTVKGGVVMIN